MPPSISTPGVGGFSSHSILMWAALAILRQDCVDSGVRAGWHQIVTIVTAINSDWLAGWRQISERERGRQRLFHVATNSWFPEMRLLSSSPTPSGKLKLRKLWQSSWKEPRYIKSDFFFFLIHQCDHKKTLLKSIKKKKKTLGWVMYLKKLSSERTSFGQS